VGGRGVALAPERRRRWLENFAARHGEVTTDGLTVSAEDGTTAQFEPPPGAVPVPHLDDLVRTVGEPRRLGLLLARKGAVAVGIADGADLVVSKVDTH